jgi:hypothetical protein
VGALFQAYSNSVAGTMLTFDFSLGSADEPRAAGCGPEPSGCAVALGSVSGAPSGLRSSGAAGAAFDASSGAAGGALSTSVGEELVFGLSESWFSVGFGGGKGTAAGATAPGLLRAALDLGLGFVAGSASGEPTGLIAAGMRTFGGPP